MALVKPKSLAISNSLTRSGNNVMTYYAGPNPPGEPQPGDEWYYTTADTLYKYTFDGVNYSWVSFNGLTISSSVLAQPNTLALRDTGANISATNFLGISSSAKYADLAEKYVSDDKYAAGIVVVFGGEKEITITGKSHDTRVAGVISTDPAYLMNSECDGLPVALTGRVPCFVKGPVNKGDLLVTSEEPGVAQVLDDTKYKPGCVFGKALGQIDDASITTIEVVVGRH
jgi:hypothetical protein